MDFPAKPHPPDDYVEAHVRRKARQLVKTGAFPRSDLEDVEQELRLHLLLQLPKFDPGKAQRHTFAVRLIERKTADMVRTCRGATRSSGRGEYSLNVSISTADGPASLSETMSDTDRRRRLGRSSLPEEERICLQIDVADAVAALPGELRDLSEQLKTKSVSQIARECGVHRSTISRRVAKIRKRFCGLSLRDYVISGATGPA